MANWFVTGAGRGLGFEIAQQLLSAGDNVIATARSLTTLEEAFGDRATSGRLLLVPLDVTDEKQAERAVEAALGEFGHIDFLVNNAGRGLLGAVEEASSAEVRAVFDTNVFGVLNVTRAVLPSMRARRSGHIVNIGSMGGFAQVAGWGVYGATKFALEGLSEAMHAELLPLGIPVTIVEPGSFRTSFLDGSSLQIVENEYVDYAETAGRIRHTVRGSSGGQPSDPARGAAAIIRAVTSDKPPLRLQVGPDAVAMVEAKLNRVRGELESWRELASDTGFVANTSHGAS
jgi:NAD(P)-dependent dehydrogenase (short-subunit alcohol dehydrogenase family)